MKFFLRLLLVATLLTVLQPLRAQEPAVSAPSPTPAIQTGGEVAALAAGEVWLALVDDNRYEDSWKSAASIFQKDVSQGQWIGILKAHRPLLGKVISRKHIKSEFAKSLLGAPEGQYVTIQYESAFENKATSVETVCLALDKDGLWKVCGYFMR